MEIFNKTPAADFLRGMIGDVAGSSTCLSPVKTRIFRLLALLLLRFMAVFLDENKNTYARLGLKQKNSVELEDDRNIKKTHTHTHTNLLAD